MDRARKTLLNRETIRDAGIQSYPYIQWVNGFRGSGFMVRGIQISAGGQLSKDFRKSFGTAYSICGVPTK